MLRKREKDTKRVVGIYIGWNAEADLWAPLENLTFWSKKNNADRISQSSSVTLIVSSIGAIVHADPDKRDQFVTIGHSFGARMLFSATAQSLITATETAHPGYPGGDYKVVKGVTDAVILLNPAFEASRYSAINDFARDKESFSKDQPPLIITISSTGDWATKSAFPIGQFLGLAWTAREMTTLGNYEPFLTHTLTASDTNACPAKRSAALVETYASDGLCLQRLEEPVNGASDDNPGVVQHFNPFIVARTTSDIIKDHNDIWNEKFITWLAELIHSLQRQNDDISKIKALNAENH
jgi:pimeloyl-ACP methyl ester carboxylesterase